MDEFSIDERAGIRPGMEFESELSASLLEDESWESIFAGNPKRLKYLEHLNGWKYRAYGEIISINPVVVDCGLLEVPDVVATNDSRVIGEFVSFMISSLEATGRLP